MRRTILFLIILLLFVQVLPLHAQDEHLDVAGVTREYRLHVPRNLDPPAPLLIALHGGGGNMAQMERFTGFSRLADREGFIVVYPQGINNAWNDGRVFDGSATRDDVSFIVALIDHLLATQPIDPDRIYATGISNGGFMSYRLGCQLSDRIAGIAPVTATLSEDLAPDCTPQQPLKVLVINGTGDPLVPYVGGFVSLPGGASRGQIRSTEATMTFWAEHNGCNAEGILTALPDSNRRDESRVEITTYSDCDSAVALYTVLNGGHTWPGGAQYLPPALIGGTNRDMDATETIWAFFEM